MGEPQPVTPLLVALRLGMRVGGIGIHCTKALELLEVPGSSLSGDLWSWSPKQTVVTRGFYYQNVIF